MKIIRRRKINILISKSKLVRCNSTLNCTKKKKKQIRKGKEIATNASGTERDRIHGGNIPTKTCHVLPTCPIPLKKKYCVDKVARPIRNYHPSFLEKVFSGNQPPEEISALLLPFFFRGDRRERERERGEH